MNILFYRYGNICEPDIVEGFQELGHTVSQITEAVSNKTLSFETTMDLVSNYLLNQPQDFVFTINFFPIISEICNIFRIPYICWIVDCPVMELFTKSIQNSCNRIFVFDYAQYSEIVNFNPECIFYFPLAVNIKQKQSAIKNVNTCDLSRFSSDVSFVGSLYTERCPYDKLKNPPSYLSGYLDGLMEAQLKIYGYYFIEELLTEDIVVSFKKHLPNFYQCPLPNFLTDRKIVSQLYIGNKITSLERIRTLELLSTHFSVDIYTGSNTSMLSLIHNKGLANTMTEMPVIFNQSKINLNTTSRPIRTGIPLRVFDIMACEGFVLTNYQTELPDLFTLGDELIAYGDLLELKELTAYYLEHPSKRKEIAHNGFERVCRDYTYHVRLEKLLSLAFQKSY